MTVQQPAEAALSESGEGLSPEDVLDEYAASLIEPDPTRRLPILERVWSDDCEIVLPEGYVHGRDAVNAHITRIRHDFGAATPVLTGAADIHNGYLRFEWRMLSPAGEILAAGVNFGELAPDGRLRRVVLFRGVRPEQYL